MPQIIELPDGTELEFPEDMSDESISSAINNNFPEFSQAPTAPIEPITEPMAGAPVQPQIEPEIQQPQIDQMPVRATQQVNIPGSNLMGPSIPEEDIIQRWAKKQEGVKGEPISGGAIETLKNIGRVYPALETAANLITSSYGIPASGIAGLLSLPLGVEKASEAVEATQKALVYQPQTRRGQQLTEAAVYPFAKLEEGAEKISAPIAEAGYPGAATALKTTITGLPAIVAGRRVMTQNVKPINSKTRALIKKGVDKAVRPSVSGKRTASQTKKYYDNAQTAVEEIVANKNNLNIRDASGTKTNKLPQTLDEFSQAIEQTKKNVFNEYDALTKDGNISVNLSKTATELEPAINNKVLADFSPDTIKYAESRMQSLNNRKNYTATEAQEAIKILNQSLEKFYRDPSPATKGQAFVDSLIANDLRLQLDNAIANAKGPGYAKLKKKYGALKAIERDVNQRAIVDARKNNKGLIDFTDIMTSSDLITGMLRSDPATFAAGAAGKGLARYYKMLNDPNKIVKAMFSELEKTTKSVPSGDIPSASVILGTEAAEAKD